MREAYVDVEPVDQQPPRGPLDPVHEALVAVVREDLLVAPLPERVGASAGEREPELVAEGVDVADRGRQILHGLVHRRADARDDLDGGLRQLLLDVVQRAVHRRQPLEDLHRPLLEVVGLRVHDLKLDLDADRGLGGSVERDLGRGVQAGVVERGDVHRGAGFRGRNIPSV